VLISFIIFIRLSASQGEIILPQAHLKNLTRRNLLLLRLCIPMSLSSVAKRSINATLPTNARFSRGAAKRQRWLEPLVSDLWAAVPVS
jgi:hypothetical protein